MFDAFQQFRDALAGRGIVPPIDLLADGIIHRCDAEGRAARAMRPICCTWTASRRGFENWRDGLGWENWRADMGRTLTPAEESAHRAKIEAARREREAEEAKRKTEAGNGLGLHRTEAYPSTGHAYLTRKGIANGTDAPGKPCAADPGHGGMLHLAAFIGADGGKRHLTGGRIRGCYFGIGKPDGVLCISEGLLPAQASMRRRATRWQ